MSREIQVTEGVRKQSIRQGEIQKSSSTEKPKKMKARNQ